MRRAALALLLLWLLAPLVPVLLWSVARGWRFPDLLPRQWTLAAWETALAPGGEALASLWLSVRIAALVALLALAIGLPAGRALGLRRFRGKRLVELAILAPALVPGIAAALGLHPVFARLGLTNGVAGVVLVHLIPALPYAVLSLAAVFARLDTDHEAQARTLGATPWQVLRHVTLPATLPGLLAGGLLAFLVSWNQYLLTLMIGGGRVATLPLQLFAYAGAGRPDLAGALAGLALLPPVVVLIVTARYLTGRSRALPLPA